MMGARRVAPGLVFAFALALCASATTASAFGTSLSTTGTPDYAAGTVPLVVTADPAVTSVTIEYRRAGESSVTVDGVQGPSGTFTYELAVPGTTIVAAHAFEGATEVWSDSAELTSSGLTPGKPVLALKRHSLVRSNTLLNGSGAARATTFTVQSHGKHGWVDEWTGAVAVADDGAFQLPAAGLPGGTFSLRVIARNGFGSRSGSAVQVYNLGAVKNYNRMVLVDKSSRRIWVIESRRVTFTCACAIGMPWTPTHTGTFRLGKRHKTPNAYWGPWRLKLWKQTKTKAGKTKYVSTKYFIHGTAVPSSIGHMASHGCVRLLNKNIRRLSTVIDGYMVVIRE